MTAQLVLKTSLKVLQTTDMAMQNNAFKTHRFAAVKRQNPLYVYLETSPIVINEVYNLIYMFRTAGLSVSLSNLAKNINLSLFRNLK